MTSPKSNKTYYFPILHLLYVASLGNSNSFLSKHIPMTNLQKKKTVSVKDEETRLTHVVMIHAVEADLQPDLRVEGCC